MHDVIARAVDLLKASGWQTTMLFAACVIFLWLVKIGVVPDLGPSVKVVGWALLLMTGALALASIGPALQRVVEDAMKPWRQRRRARAAEQWFSEHIPHLTEQDRRILGYIREKKLKTFLADHDGGHAATLLARGIIVYAGARGQSFDLDAVPMVVPDHVWKVLAERPDEFPYVPKYHSRDRKVEVQPWRIPMMAR